MHDIFGHRRRFYTKSWIYNCLTSPMNASLNYSQKHSTIFFFNLISRSNGFLLNKNLKKNTPPLKHKMNISKYYSHVVRCRLLFGFDLNVDLLMFYEVKYFFFCYNKVSNVVCLFSECIVEVVCSLNALDISLSLWVPKIFIIPIN